MLTQTIAQDKYNIHGSETIVGSFFIAFFMSTQFQKLVSTFFKNKVKVNRIQMQSFCLHVTRKKPRKKCLLSDYWVEQTLGKSFRLLKSTKSTKVQEYSPILVVFTYIRYSYFIDHTEPKASILYVSYIYICVTHCIAEWIILSMANLSM